MGRTGYFGMPYTPSQEKVAAEKVKENALRAWVAVSERWETLCEVDGAVSDRDAAFAEVMRTHDAYQSVKFT